MVEYLGDEVVLVSTSSIASNSASIVPVVSAKSLCESISPHACKFTSQRSPSLVLCFDACDSWLTLILLLMKNKENVPYSARQTGSLSVRGRHCSKRAV